MVDIIDDVMRRIRIRRNREGAGMKAFGTCVVFVEVDGVGR